MAGLRAEAAEYLRKRSIGKHVNVTIDYHQPKSDNFEAKEMATVKLANGSNLAEALVERGYVTVIRHRQGDEDKSSEIDKLMEVEAKYVFLLRCSAQLSTNAHIFRHLVQGHR